MLKHGIRGARSSHHWGQIVSRDFDLFLFSTDLPVISMAVEAGITGIVVDWEQVGKEHRQRGADTQINHDTVQDLRRVRGCTDAVVLCRLNQYNGTTATEVNRAIDAGADEVLLPMVRTPREVGAVLEMARGRCAVGILVETVEAVSLITDLASLPLSRIYVGLNDLAIDRGCLNIFTPIIDGTIERLQQRVHIPFGFGGLTLPERGDPIPARLLIGEMTRLRCQFSFLCRSFHADIKGRNMTEEVPRIFAAIRSSLRRSSTQIDQERAELVAAVPQWQPRKFLV